MLDDLLKTLTSVYGDAATLLDRQTAHLVVDGQDLLSRQTVPGVTLSVHTEADVIEAELVVASGVKLERPIHTCIGITQSHGRQRIRMRIRIEPNASAPIVAHCLFPNAEAAEHFMDAEIEIGEGAELFYSEGHYHGPYGGIEVRPHAVVRIGPHGRYISEFTLTTGRVGKLDIDYRVELAEHAVAEITARVFGHATDEIRIKDELVLAGKYSRGLIKTRVALEGDARADVLGITRGQAEGARGHMDCLELVRDRALARAEPIVEVSHSLAKVTHEAAVGTVDQKQLETLMAHGLTPEQAVDVIITGMLR